MIMSGAAGAISQAGSDSVNHWITRAISSGLFQDDDASPAVPLPDAGIVPGGFPEGLLSVPGQGAAHGFPGLSRCRVVFRRRRSLLRVILPPPPPFGNWMT